MADRQGAAQPGRSRAKARGRAVAQAQNEGARRPGTAPGPPQAAPAAPTAAAVAPAAARVASAVKPEQGAIPRGRAARGERREVPSGGAGAVGGLAAEMSNLALGGPKDDANRGGGRGAYRGRSETQIVKSRPASAVTKQGTSGEPVNLLVNYFQVTSKPNWAMYHYHVEFNPIVEGNRTRSALLHDHDKMLGKSYVFDGMALFTAARLEQDEMDLFSTRRSDDAKIRIHIKLARELHHNDPVVLQICNIQMRKNLQHLQFALVGRHYYDIANSATVHNHNMELWPGFTTAIHEHENKSIMMCVDQTFKVLRLDTVYDQMEQCYRDNYNRYKDVATQTLVGCVVLTQYNNKTYKIDDIEWEKTPKDTFDLKDGSKMSYMQYYKEHWNIQIKHPGQPMLVSIPKKRDAARGQGNALLVPELCIMTGLSEETRKNFTVMKEIAVHTRKSPDDRVKILRTFMKRILDNAAVQSDMTGWDMKYSPELVKVSGRQLATESILQNGGHAKFTYKKDTADWTGPMRTNILYQPMPLNNWILVCTDRDSRVARDFLNTLQRVGPPMGVEVDHPRVVTIQNDRMSDFINALQNSVTRDAKLALCVVPNNRKDRYDAIKKYCCIDNPVPSQVVVARTISKPGMLMSVCTKIAIQLNCKLGGSAWAVEIPMKTAMVIGYDSYHDSSKQGRSAGGLCCSTNASMTQFYSRVTFQTSHQEMLNGFRSDLTASFRRYYEINKTLPERVFVYRDGVGEGQLQQVLDYELDQVKECFKELGNYNPLMTFIVVTKRINTRIMEQQRNGVVNPLPGTVVDSVITRPEWYDFFLVSQSVKQGTVSPTHYNVIYDTSGLRPEHIQRLTYKLTHQYYNWPGTIRVPAPCMYAHKLAFLSGQSLHASPSTDLADTLFYL